MACTSMGLDDVEDQLNDTDKNDISEIDILLHYWKGRNGKLMVKVTRLYTLGGDYIKAKDMKVDYPGTIVMYIIRSSIGVKSSQKVLCSRDKGNWHKWGENFINSQTRRIERLLRILGKYFLKDFFGSH